MSLSLQTVLSNSGSGDVFLWTYIYTITTVLCVRHTYTMVVCVLLNYRWRLWQFYLLLLLMDFSERIYDLVDLICLCTSSTNLGNHCSEPLLLLLQRGLLSQQLIRSTCTICSLFLLSPFHMLAFCWLFLFRGWASSQIDPNKWQPFQKKILLNLLELLIHLHIYATKEEPPELRKTRYPRGRWRKSCIIAIESASVICFG